MARTVHQQTRPDVAGRRFARAIDQLLRRLPPKQRLAVIETVRERLSVTERDTVAEVIGLPACDLISAHLDGMDDPRDRLAAIANMEQALRDRRANLQMELEATHGA